MMNNNQSCIVPSCIHRVIDRGGIALAAACSVTGVGTTLTAAETISITHDEAITFMTDWQETSVRVPRADRYSPRIFV